MVKVIGFLKIITERTVWTQALAVPEIVLVKGVVYLICKKVAILIKNPVIPVMVITVQKDGLLKKYTFLISLTSPENKTTGISKIMAKVVL